MFTVKFVHEIVFLFFSCLLIIKFFYVVKVCEKRHIIREKKQQYIKREKEVMMLLSDSIKTTAPFFVRLYCTFHDTDKLCKFAFIRVFYFSQFTSYIYWHFFQILS